MPEEFILNKKRIVTNFNPARSLLDFLRKEEKLTGPKEVCKEGDCGACAVLIGEEKGSVVTYKSVASCIYPLGNVQGKHVVTIEGLTGEDLNFIQYHFAKEDAAQCGYCTPGYVSSLTAYFLKSSQYSIESAIDSVSGNICRCTGYASIKRAIVNMINEINSAPLRQDEKLNFLVRQKIIPEYFKDIPERLAELKKAGDTKHEKGTPIAGGTDLLVQQPEELTNKQISFLTVNKNSSIFEQNGEVVLSADTTFEDFGESTIIRKYFPDIDETLKLIASPLIRNVATIGGNIVNASPIGDFTIILLALDAKVVLENKTGEKRTVALKDFYKGYKALDKSSDELLTEIKFSVSENLIFNFEKVSKRTHLDIASVNTALAISLSGETIENIGLSAGGVAPVPKYLTETASYLKGKEINNETVLKAAEISRSEILPISDVRGSADYKKALLGRLIEAHFFKLFPQFLNAEVLL